jgi:tryptophan 2,3-dioxygenase
MANSIYPLNAHEAQMRRDYLLRANAELNSLISQIEVAHELFGLEHNVMKFWMDIVEREIRLVKGTLKKDRERYKNLP